MDLELAGKVALVTAASKGLGKAAAWEFAREGARVAICSHSAAIETTADEIRQDTGVDVMAMQADVTQQADIDSLVKATLDHFGQIDILVTNAPGPAPGSFMSLTPQSWEEAVQVTLMSAVRLCYAVLPHMLERGSGSIVASQSRTVKDPMDNLILSNAIRMAVVGLVKSLANEVGPQGIRVNSINPGWVWTERVVQIMNNRAGNSGATVDEEVEKATATVPLKRMATVEEYGRAIVWLASPAAAYVHGHALIFDGGVTKAPL